MKPYASTPETKAEVEKTASDWVTRCDAGLTTAEQQIFQDWLAADVLHADAFHRLSEAWSVFDRVQEGGVISLVLAGLERRARQHRTRRIQTAAAVTVFCVGLLWVNFREAAPGLVPESVGVQLATNDRVQRLPDGSVVELNEGSEITVNYQPDARRVTLVTGEAFFRVAKDATRPFLVESHGITVRAVGTAFSVQARSTAVEIFVKEGAVDVGHSPVLNTTSGSGNDQQMVRVVAGKRFLALIKLTPALRTDQAPQVPAAEPMGKLTAEPQTVTEEEMDGHLSWRETLQEFNGTTLDEAVALMNRQNLAQIIINDPAVGRLRVDGYFRSDNPEGFVRIVAESFGLKAEEQDGHSIRLHARP